MIVDRYYYSQLNEQERGIYKKFYKGVIEYQEIIPISMQHDFSQKQFEHVFMAMTRDNPLIYFLNQSTCSIAIDRFGNIAICPQYFLTKEKVKEYNRKIEKVVNELVEKLRLLEGSNYEKELRIHDWICQNIEYDYEGNDVDKVSQVIVSHNILGVFAYHKAQCEGIAKAVKVLLNAVDVKCIVVTGESVKNGQGVPHAWNIVDIETEPYQLDVTWDIGAMGQREHSVVYDYFNLTDELMNQDHKADSSLPVCRSKKANYYVQSGCSFQMRRRLMAYIDRLMEQNKQIYEFRVEGRLNKPFIEKEVTDHILQRLREQGRNSAGIRICSNKKLGIYRIEI